MTAINEREKPGVVVAEPPVILETPETTLPAPIPTVKPRGRWTVGRIARIGRWASAGLAAIGIAQSGAVPVALDALSEFLKSRETNIAARMARESRSLGPLPGEQASWWMELPEERIRELAQLPEIHQIGDKYVSTVSPVLQERAQQAGYKLIYQGDPEDTAGRSVIAKDREIDTYWATHDLGFGRGGTIVRGIFEAWVPDPRDQNQKEKVFALLKDPITHREFMIAVQLFPFDPNQFDIRPTWFVVDDLYHGPDNKDPSAKGKKATDYPTFNELLREKGLDLQNLVSPGDYVRVSMQVAGVDETKGINKYKTDDTGISRSMMIIVRRFGGSKQWQSEVQR